MNLKAKISKYFGIYDGKSVFTKSIAILVVVCFILNVVNLPAFASTKDDELRKKQIKTEQTNSGVLYQGDQSYGSVSYMQFLEDNTDIDENNAILVKNANGKYEAKGYWDLKTQTAKIIGPDGKAVDNDTYTNVVKNKLYGVKKEGNTIPQRTDTVVVSAIPQTTLQSSVPEQSVSERTPVPAVSQLITQSAASQSQADLSQEQPASEVISIASQEQSVAEVSAEEKVQQTLKALADKSKSTKKEFIEKSQKNKKYDEVVDELVKQTGLSREEVEADLAKLSKTQRKGVIDALANLFAQGKTIVFCAADALATVLNATNKGLLAFQVILADAIAGIFVKNNQDLISGKSNQLMISAQAIQTVLAKYGRKYNGYSASLDNVINALGAGESAILHVGGNHFITITRNEVGTYTISDPNKESKTVTADKLKTVMKSEYGLKENDRTTVLAKGNKQFKNIKPISDLSKITGAETQEEKDRKQKGLYDAIKAAYKAGNIWRTGGVKELIDNYGGFDALLNQKFSNEIAARIYTLFGDDAYSLMQELIFGKGVNLNHQQSEEFAVKYNFFLKYKALPGLNKILNESSTICNYSEKEIADFKKQRDRLIGDMNSEKEALKQSLAWSYTMGVMVKDVKIDWAKYGIDPNMKDDSYTSKKFNALVDKLFNSYDEAAIIALIDWVYDNTADASIGWYNSFENNGKRPQDYRDNAKKAVHKYFSETKFQLQEVNRKLNVENAKEEKQMALAGLDKAAKEIAILNVTITILEQYKGSTLSGQIGQILTTNKVSVPGLPAGDYYQMITISADWSGKNSTIKRQEYDQNGKPLYNNDGSLHYEEISIPAYSITVENSISTQEGSVVTRSDGSTYKVFGVEGKFEGQDVIWEYRGAIYGGTFYMSDYANIYLRDDTSSVYQEKEDKEKPPPQSAKYSGAAPRRDNWTSAIIVEDENGYTATGAGNRITVKKSGSKWKAEIVGMGTEALTGSSLQIASYDSKGNAYRIYLDIKLGSMTYAGSYWAVSNGIVWGFNAEKNTSLQVEEYIENIIRAQLSAGEDNEGKVGNILIDGTYDYQTVIMYGAPFSAGDILNSIHCSAEVEIKAGYVFDATQQGDIYIATINASTTIILKADNNGMLSFYATEDINVTFNLAKNEDGSYDWLFSDDTGSQTAIINQNQKISLATLLNNTGLNIKNNKEVKMIAGYEEIGKDENGDPIYGDPIYVIFVPGQLVLSGNTLGEYILAKDVYVDFDDENGFSLDNDQSGNSFNEGRNKGCFRAGAIMDITRSIDAKGNVTYYASVTDGTLDVYNLDGVHVPKPKDDSSGDNENQEDDDYDGPNFHGKVGSEQDDGDGGHIYGGITGYFTHISTSGLSKKTLGNYLYAIGSTLDEGSVLPDGSKSKYAAEIKKDGSIDFKMSGWEKFRDGFIGFWSSLAFGLVTILSLGATFWATNMKGMEAGRAWAVKTSSYFSHVYVDPVKMGAQVAVQAAVGGIVALAVLVIAIVSILSALVTAGFTAIACIAALIAVIGAFTGANSVMEMTSNATKLFQMAAKEKDANKKAELLKNAFINLGLAILIGVITAFGASGAASQITKGITIAVKSMATFALRVTIMISVGGVLGGFVIPTIVSAIQGKKGTDALTWNWEGFVTGLFSGASLGISWGAMAGDVTETFSKVGMKQLLQVFTGTTGSTLKMVGRFVGNVLLTALNTYITYQTAKSLVNSIRTGDFVGAISALYSLISLNIISQLAKASEMAKEAKDLAEAAKEVGLELEDLGEEAGNAAGKVMNAAEAETGVVGQEAAVAAEELTAGQKLKIFGASIFGFTRNASGTFEFSLGTLGRFWGPTIIGAVVGIVVSSIIVAAQHRKPSKKDILAGFGIGLALGFIVGRIGSMEDVKSIWESLKTSVRKSIAPMFGWVRDAGRGWVWQASTLARVWATAAVTTVVGMLLVFILNSFGVTDLPLWTGAVVGAVLGFGIGNAIAVDAYGQSLKEGVKTIGIQIADSLRPSKLFYSVIRMSQGIAVFNLKFMYATGLIDLIYRKIFGGSLADIGWLVSIDKFVGFNFLEKGLKLVSDKDISDKYGDKSQIRSDDGAVKNKYETLSGILYQNVQMLFNPSQMFIFLALAGILLPILGPALQHSPILGSVMITLNGIGELSFMQGNGIQGLYEEGFKEQVAGSVGKYIFGDSQAGQIFQELFDSSSEDERNEDMKFLASANIDVNMIENAVKGIAASTTDQELSENLRNAFKNLNIPYENIMPSSFSIGMSADQITRGILTEIAINKARMNSFFIDFGEPGNYSWLFLEDEIRNTLGNILLPKDASIAQQLNFLYANAAIIGIGININPDIGITVEQAAEIMNKAQAKQSDLGFIILANYASGIAAERTWDGMSTRQNSVILGNIIQGMYQSSHISDGSLIASSTAVYMQSLIKYSDFSGNREMEVAISNILDKTIAIGQEKADKLFRDTYRDNEGIKDARRIQELEAAGVRVIVEYQEGGEFEDLVPLREEIELTELKTKYSPETIKLNTYINDLINLVDSGKLSALDFRLLLSSRNDIYFLQTDLETRSRLSGYRETLQNLVKQDARSTIDRINQGLRDGKYSAQYARNMRNEIIEASGISHHLFDFQGISILDTLVVGEYLPVAQSIQSNSRFISVDRISQYIDINIAGIRSLVENDSGYKSLRTDNTELARLQAIDNAVDLLLKTINDPDISEADKKTVIDDVLNAAIMQTLSRDTVQRMRDLSNSALIAQKAKLAMEALQRGDNAAYKAIVDDGFVNAIRQAILDRIDRESLDEDTTPAQQSAYMNARAEVMAMGSLQLITQYFSESEVRLQQEASKEFQRTIDTQMRALTIKIAELEAKQGRTEEENLELNRNRRTQ
ncbi:MAG: hypothetical protein LBT18_04725 [Endomicrobium sp.]|nr:hypothetical protein [Endomicrobium sp.]